MAEAELRHGVILVPVDQGLVMALPWHGQWVFICLVSEASGPFSPWWRVPGSDRWPPEGAVPTASLPSPSFWAPACGGSDCYT